LRAAHCFSNAVLKRLFGPGEGDGLVSDHAHGQEAERVVGHQFADVLRLLDDLGMAALLPRWRSVG
jgi:hypothetical protein